MTTKLQWDDKYSLTMQVSNEFDYGLFLQISVMVTILLLSNIDCSFFYLCKSIIKINYSLLIG